MQRLRRISAGLPTRDALDKLGREEDDLKLPTLVTRSPASQSTRSLRVLLRRPTLSRRGAGTLLEAEDAALEARAAGDIDGPLADRILAQALRDRRLQFQYQNDPENRPLLQVDFLISSLQPPLALDIRERRSSDPASRAYGPSGAASSSLAASYGYRYASIAEQDVLGDELIFTAQLDRILGDTTGIMPYPTSQGAF